MRVLLVSPLPPPYGGISHWTRMILDALADCDGTELVVLDTAPRRRRKLQQAVAFRVIDGFLRLSSDTIRFAWLTATKRPDVVHLNTSGGLAFFRDVALLRIARILRVPTVYHLRFGRLPDIADSQNWEYRWALRAVKTATHVIAIDPRTYSCVSGWIGAKRVALLPNPIDLSKVPRKAFAESYSRENVVLFVGWLVPKKGIAELLSAWSSVDTRGWRLEVVGPADPAYLAKIDSSRLPSSVSLVGELSHSAVLERMQQARVLVFPSHTEGFPNAVAEAMASGLAVIGTDVGAIPWMLADGAGLIVPMGNALALKRSIEHVISQPNVMDAIASRARERAHRDFSLEAVLKRYVDLWSTVAKRR